MPSWELFNDQSQEYRDLVIPPRIKKRLVIEAGSPQGWHRYSGDEGGILGMDQFGASAPGGVLLREFGYTADNVCGLARNMLSPGKEE